MIEEYDAHEREPLTPEEDAELRLKIKDAFDEVKLSDASRASMLAALKQAQAQPAAEPPRKTGRSVARVLRFVLPAAAACLALVLVVATVNMPSGMSVNSSAQKQGAQSHETMLQEQGAQDASSTMNMAQERAEEYESAALSAAAGEWLPVVELSDTTRMYVTHDVVEAPAEGKPEEARAMSEDAGRSAPCVAIRIDSEHCAVSFDNEIWYMAASGS